MNRKGSREDFLALAERIRTKMPHAVLRTTLIAGFPGETEEQFEDLCDFVGGGALRLRGRVRLFPRRGHPRLRASRQLDEDEKARPRAASARRGRRLLHARASPRALARRWTCWWRGAKRTVSWFGRAMCQAPEVDGVVYLMRARWGRSMRVRIVDTLLYEMEGELA